MQARKSVGADLHFYIAEATPEITGQPRPTYVAPARFYTPDLNHQCRSFLILSLCLKAQIRAMALKEGSRREMFIKKKPSRHQ